MTTLVSFLGTGNYQRLRYAWGGQACESRYVTDALRHFFQPRRIRILATQEAERQHGEGLRAVLTEDGVPVDTLRLPTGDDPDTLKRQFAIFLQALEVPADETLIIDITHGFRAQPFYAATALATLQAAGQLPKEVRIVYGAAKTPVQDGDTASIWELTPFLHRLEEAFGVITFLHTGDASLLIGALKRADDSMRRRAHERGEDPSAFRSRALIQALRRFTEEMRFLRVPALTIGIGERAASSRMLLDALDEYAESCRREHPALALLLDNIRKIIAPLPCATLSDRRGQKALLALARQFLQWGQYAEAAAVTREGLVCLYADGPEATDAGGPAFSDAARQMAEQRFTANARNRQMASIRNTIEHCAFREIPTQKLEELVNWNPKRDHPLRGDLESLLDEFARQIEEGPLARNSQEERPRTLFITRHAGAREWARRQGIVVDEMLDHIEPDMVHPGDLVIGSLPIHLVAEINRRGARYKHLTLDIPPEKRGEELSADDMEKFGARLEEFRVERPAQTTEKDT